MSYLRDVEAALGEIRAQNRYREILPAQAQYKADFSTNDYLGLATDSRMIEALRHVKRVGSGGARLLGGRHREHALLEADVASWLGRDRALLFSSGYLAALGAIAVLARFATVVYSDELNHACLIDGIRASGLRREILPHNQLPAKDAKRGPALVVSESLFGMNGDYADVSGLLNGMREDDILLLDEAHALGVTGREGAGVAGGNRDDRIVILGTLGKAVGAAGGFIAGPDRLIELLVNTSRTFIFDTALPPALAFAARVGVMLARGSDDGRNRLRASAERLRSGIEELGFPRIAGGSPIVPVVVGEEAGALELMRRALERGVYAPAVRPPTVPPGTSRLRISVRADHTPAHIDLLLEALACTVTS